MTKAKWSLSAAAVVLATAMFWATMLISPPKLEAALHEGVDIKRLSSTAHPNMAKFEDTYQRHTGVLDVLRP
jgi:hypothetical protein